MEKKIIAKIIGIVVVVAILSPFIFNADPSHMLLNFGGMLYALAMGCYN